MKNLILFVSILILSTSGGCASLVRGDRQKVTFDTDPQGATVQVGQTTATTPAKIPLKRKEVHQVTISKPGYRTVEFELRAQWDGASIGSFALPGGSIWATTDRVSGADLAFYKLEKIKLEPTTSPSESPLKLIQYRGKLYNDEEYAKVMEEERAYREDITGY